MSSHGPSTDEEELDGGVGGLYVDNAYRLMLLVFLYMLRERELRIYQSLA